jgi:hypothetical protein
MSARVAGMIVTSCDVERKKTFHSSVVGFSVIPHPNHPPTLSGVFDDPPGIML